MKHIFLILLIILSAEISAAQVYKWVDEKGAVHFTDDIIQVPEKYRSQVERIGVPEEKVEKKTEPEPKVMKKEDAYKDRLGRGEDYWKGLTEEWNKKLKESQEKVNNLRTKYNELTERFNDSRNTSERANLRKERDDVKNEMERYKAKIEEAKHMLEKKIPEEAEIFKAKPEWIKQ